MVTPLETRIRTMFDHKIAAVLRMGDADAAYQATRCLISAGFKLVELTMTTPGAIDIIKTVIKEDHPGVMIGAGTVMDAATARSSITAGAHFVVSAISELDIIRPCRESGVVCIPGATTPTEIVQCWRAGANVIKVFPAGVIGGVPYIKAIRGPLPEIPLWVSGFTPAKDAQAYLAAGVKIIGLTTELFPEGLISAKQWPELTTHMRSTLQLAQHG